MSAYSTLYLTRSKALEFLLQAVVDGPDSSLLEDLLDRILRDRRYNVTVMPDWFEPNDDEVV